MAFQSPSFADIQTAQSELSRFLSPTPLLRSAWLSDALHCELYLKLETMSAIGSFKIRGASYKISRLSEAEKKAGVIAASAGNHAQGVAWGSRRYGVDAVIVMPKSAPLTKVLNTQALGAKVILEGDSYDEAFAAAQRIQNETGRTYIHAYLDTDVIAGQGTVGLEILSQLPETEWIISSMGGGGLLAGIAIVCKELSPSVRLIGGQAEGAASLVRSIETGKAVKSAKAETFADGIAIAEAKEPMRALLAPLLSEVHTVNDEAIASAVLTLLEKAKVVAEGAGALPLAIAEKIQAELKGKKVVLVIGGGNIDVNLLGRIIDRGLIRAGRRLRVNAVISDRPGSLNRLTQIIAREGGSILQVIHDRNEPGTTIDQTDVQMTLETRGPDHSRALIQAIKDQVIRLDEQL